MCSGGFLGGANLAGRAQIGGGRGGPAGAAGAGLGLGAARA